MGRARRAFLSSVCKQCTPTGCSTGSTRGSTAGLACALSRVLLTLTQGGATSPNVSPAPRSTQRPATSTSSGQQGNKALLGSGYCWHWSVWIWSSECMRLRDGKRGTQGLFGRALGGWQRGRQMGLPTKHVLAEITKSHLLTRAARWHRVEAVEFGKASIKTTRSQRLKLTAAVLFWNNYNRGLLPGAPYYIQGFPR